MGSSMTELLIPQQDRANSVARIDPAILARLARFYRRPNRRRDLNLVLSSIESCSINPTGTRDHRAVLFEHANRASVHASGSREGVGWSAKLAPTAAVT